MIPKEVLDETVKAASEGVLKQFYMDALHPSASTIGEVLNSVVKTLAIATYPFAKGANLYQKTMNNINKSLNQVPEDNRIFPASQVLLEYLDKTKFLSEVSLIQETFNHLLASAMNSEKVNMLHPAFLLIIPQLSSDEIVILKKLKKNNFKLVERSMLDTESRKFTNTTICENDFPISELHQNNYYLMYTTRLEKLGLTNFRRIDSVPERNGQNVQIALLETYELRLNDFGHLFATTCLEN